MKNRVIAACVAALAFAACDKSPNPSPAGVVAPPRAAPVVAVAPPSALDAGVESEAALPPDVVALDHEHRGRVDHLARAADLRQQGDLEGALAEARRAVFDAPNDDDALEQAALLAKQVGQRDIAIEAFERLARIRSEDPQPLLQEARLLVAKHDDEGAIEVAREALVRDDDSAEAYQLIGRAHLHQGELQSAIDAFVKVLEIDPSHGYAMNNLGLAYLRSNQNQKAVEILTQAAEFLPQVAYVQNNLGVALERVGQVDEAKLAYARATNLSPKYVKAELNAKRVKRLASSKDQPVDPEDAQGTDE
jgi:tetratricopeptide (TPR) repeat protein